MDKETHNALGNMKLSNIGLIALADFERGDGALGRAKENRSQIEYYFTCTPSLPLFILRNFSEVKLITYLDADLYFFSNPDVIYREIGSHSIAIVGHNFAPQARPMALSGLYNVGWLSFRRDENGLACLDWWRRLCNEWCQDRVDGDRFADQKYLDDWPARFKDVVILQNKGINVAPWNVENYKVHTDKNNVWVDDQLLIFFHFHGLRHLIWRFYYTGLSFYRVRINNMLRGFIYSPYLKTLLSIKRNLPDRGHSYYPLRTIRTGDCLPFQKNLYRKITQFLYTVYRIIVFNDYVVISGDY